MLTDVIPNALGRLGISYRLMINARYGKRQRKVGKGRRILAHLGLTATYSLMGRDKEARAEVAEVLRLNPKYSVEYAAKTSIFKEQSQTDKVFNALRKAGLK